MAIPIVITVHSKENTFIFCHNFPAMKGGKKGISHVFPSLKVILDTLHTFLRRTHWRHSFSWYIDAHIEQQIFWIFN